MPGPLNGIRVLDFTTVMSGPIATMMLADQGAEVIKVEPPDGEVMRQMGRDHCGMTDVFACSNRSKRSLAVDLKSKQGLRVVKELVATADVVVQNFRPGVIEKLGLAEEAVREIRPDIIFVSMSGVGESGPYSGLRTYDPIVQALSGLADIQSDRETGEPRMVRLVVSDKTTAVTAAQAITAALFARERGGGGQHVRLSMLDAMVAYLWPEGMASLTFVGRETDPAAGQLGLDLVYKTKDRYITAGAVSDAEWNGMCTALGRPELIDDERFRTNEDRSRNVAARRAITSEEIRAWSADEILALFREHDVPCAPVLDRWQLLDDPQIIHNELLSVTDDPVLGSVRQPRPAARFDRTPAIPRGVAPFLGADNHALLAEIGYSQTDVEEMIQADILGQSRSGSSTP